jgi:hypothetical protein
MPRIVKSACVGVLSPAVVNWKEIIAVKPKPVPPDMRIRVHRMIASHAARRDPPAANSAGIAAASPAAARPAVLRSVFHTTADRVAGNRVSIRGKILRFYQPDYFCKGAI